MIQGEPRINRLETMEEYFDKTDPGLDEDEARQVKELIRWILQYDLSKRPAAAEILAHPWFRSIEHWTRFV